VKGCQEEKTFKKGTAHTTMYTQGLGKPRMSSGERVLDMMAQLDEHSDKIPEGMYLQFCDHLKFFYQNDEKIKKRWRRKGGRPRRKGGTAIAGGGRDGKATGDRAGAGGGVGGRGKAGGRDEKATGERAGAGGGAGGGAGV